MLSVVVIDRRNLAVSTAHTAKYPPQFDHEHMSTEVGWIINCRTPAFTVRRTIENYRMHRDAYGLVCSYIVQP